MPRPLTRRRYKGYKPKNRFTFEAVYERVWRAFLTRNGLGIRLM